MENFQNFWDFFKKNQKIWDFEIFEKFQKFWDFPKKMRFWNFEIFIKNWDFQKISKMLRFFQKKLRFWDFQKIWDFEILKFFENFWHFEKKFRNFNKQIFEIFSTKNSSFSDFEIFWFLHGYIKEYIFYIKEYILHGYITRVRDNTGILKISNQQIETPIDVTHCSGHNYIYKNIVLQR